MPGDDSYLKIVGSLPQPTRQQTALFASYVAAAHSWYKHIPITRLATFHLFLDPHAGEYLTRNWMWRKVLRPIEDTKGHLHYTAQKTTDYRRRFGFWNYDQQYGTRLLYLTGSHVTDTGGWGPQIVSSNGKWIPVSAEVLRLGSAEVTATIHHHPSIDFWERCLGGDPKAGFPRLELWLRDAEAKSGPAVLPEVPPELLAATERLNPSDALPSGDLWDDETLLGELLAAAPDTEGRQEDLFEALLEHLEYRRSRSGLAWVSHFFKFDFESLYPLVASERLRQLRRLKAAMHGVLEFVYGNRGRT
jgi:hypothetical protein